MGDVRVRADARPIAVRVSARSVAEAIDHDGSKSCSRHRGGVVVARNCAEAPEELAEGGAVQIERHSGPARRGFRAGPRGGHDEMALDVISKAVAGTAK